MAVDPSFSAWLKQSALYAVSAVPGAAAAWGDKTISSAVVSPLSSLSDAQNMADLQAAALAGPLVQDKAVVKGLRSDLIGRCITLRGDRLGYGNGPIDFAPILDGWADSGSGFVKTGSFGWGNSVFSVETISNASAFATLVDHTKGIFVGLEDVSAGLCYAAYCYPPSGKILYLIASNVGNAGIVTVNAIVSPITAADGQRLGVQWVGPNLHLFVGTSDLGAFPSSPAGPGTPMRLAVSSVENPGTNTRLDDVAFFVADVSVFVIGAEEKENGNSTTLTVLRKAA